MRLTEFVDQNPAVRDRYEVLKSIAELIENGIYVGLSPENIEVKPDYKVEIIEDPKLDSAYFMSPEQVLRGEKPTRNSAWFSFGMLYYYVVRGRSWYSCNPVRVHEILDQEMRIHKQGSQYETINRLLSHIPEERYKGYEAFLRRIEDLSQGEVTVNYICDGQCIWSEKLQLDNKVDKIDNYAANKKIVASNGDIYITNKGVDIQCRFIDQTVSVPVSLYKSATAHSYKIRLQKGSDTENRRMLFDIEDTHANHYYPITLGNIKTISFWKLEVDAQGNFVDENKIKVFRMPKIRQKALLNIRYDGRNSIVSVGLLDIDKRHKLVSEDLFFSIIKE